MKIYPYIFSLLACIGIALPGYSQVDRNETLIRSALHGLEYEIKAGFSIGGTAPLPLPVEIRSIDGYNPTLAISIGGRSNQMDCRSEQTRNHSRTPARKQSNDHRSHRKKLQYGNSRTRR